MATAIYTHIRMSKSSAHLSRTNEVSHHWPSNRESMPVTLNMQEGFRTEQFMWPEE